MLLLLALVFGEERGGEEKIRTQKSEQRSKIIYRRVAIDHTYTSTIRSVVSELQTLLRNVLAWYGSFVRLLRIFKHRTKVPYPYLHNKFVPYKHTVLFRKS